MHDAPQRIFHGGPILTMDAGVPRVEAIAVRDGIIEIAGRGSDVLALADSETIVTNLGGRALLPGFIDGHGHIAKVASALGVADLTPPPAGSTDTLAGLIQRLREFLTGREFRQGDWLLGRGYDDSQMQERRHPTASDLDAVSSEIPIFITHVSGHLGVGNSRALEMAGYVAGVVDPAGGLIRRLAGTDVPSGIVEETALAAFSRGGLIPQPDAAQEEELFAEAERMYFRNGLTTAQEGVLLPPEQALLDRLAGHGRLGIDVIGYAAAAAAERMLEGRRIGAYDGNFRLNGMKLILDGSPQGKSAWLTQPYHVPPDGQEPGYRGYSILQDDQVRDLCALAFERGWQVIAHCNGDAAADQYLAAIREAVGHRHSPELRPVMIHAQTVREDQLDAMDELGVLPSFFASHVFYWGDWHRDSVLGPERAKRISPLRSALDRGIRFNLHNDSPVVPPDMLRLLWCAVVRETRSGAILGDEQRIDIESALRAVTIDAAYAHFEENEKGSIVAGKAADLVVLSENPTAIAPERLQEVRVVETVKRGETVFGGWEPAPR